MFFARELESLRTSFLCSDSAAFTALAKAASAASAAASAAAPPRHYHSTSIVPGALMAGLLSTLKRARFRRAAARSGRVPTPRSRRTAMHTASSHSGATSAKRRRTRRRRAEAWPERGRHPEAGRGRETDRRTDIHYALK